MIVSELVEFILFLSLLLKWIHTSNDSLESAVFLVGNGIDKICETINKKEND